MSNRKLGKVSAAKAEKRVGGRKQSQACAASSDSINPPSQRPTLSSSTLKSPERERETTQHWVWYWDSESRFCALWHGGDDTSIIILFENPSVLPSCWQGAFISAMEKSAAAYLVTHVSHETLSKQSSGGITMNCYSTIKKYSITSKSYASCSWTCTYY